MNRKWVIVVIALGAILLVNNLNLFGRSGLGSFLDLLVTGIIIYRARVLYKKIPNAPVPLPNLTGKPSGFYQPVWAAKSAATVTPPKTAATTAGQFWVIGLIFMFVFIAAGYQLVGAGAFNFFVWGDHLLGTAHGYPPVIMWALVGLAVGAVTGSLVSWRKYHIKFQWCLLTLVPFIAVLVLLQALSTPLSAISPRPLAVGADAAQQKMAVTDPLIPKRKKRGLTKLRVPPDTAVRPTNAAKACMTQLANVSINARGDSVNIYYRTANYQNGPWSDWKSKFVPQQGQFALTDGSEVRANSLQYYYEVKSVLTRSAQNPYTRLLCDGPLIIDTY